MNIQIIETQYRLPFNPRKSLSFIWEGCSIVGNIITVYVIIELPRTRWYYSIVKANDVEKYFLIRHQPRKLYHNDNKLRVDCEFKSYDEIKTYMETNILEWKTGANRSFRSVLVDIINIKAEEK